MSKAVNKPRLSEMVIKSMQNKRKSEDHMHFVARNKLRTQKLENTIEYPLFSPTSFQLHSNLFGNSFILAKKELQEVLQAPEEVKKVIQDIHSQCSSDVT